MKYKHTITIADIQMNIITEEDPEVVESMVGILDRRIREIFLKSENRCPKIEAALLCALDYCAEKNKLQETVNRMEEERRGIDIEAMLAELEALKEENRELNEKLTYTEDQAHTLKNGIDIANDQIRILKAQVDNANTVSEANEALNDKLAELEEALAKEKSDRAEIYEKLCAAEKEKVEAAEELEKAKEEFEKAISELENALAEKVWLKSGAYLIIQPTEALTVIDVNTGKNVAKKDVQENFLKINKEAAIEIAHQLRLRNISGIIVVDFMNLASKEAEAELMSTFRVELKKDPVPTQLIDITKLGLVEVTRKKVRKSLGEVLR